MKPLLLLLPALALLAHHSVDVEYNRAAETTYRATITSVTFVNPHARFSANVASPEGRTVRWEFEMGSPNALAKLAITRDTLRVGDIVTVTAFPAKDGSPNGTARRIVLADGRALEVADAWGMAPKGFE